MLDKLKSSILKSRILGSNTLISGHLRISSEVTSLMHLYLKPRLSKKKKVVSYKGSSNLFLALCKAGQSMLQLKIGKRRCIHSGTGRSVFNIKNVSRLRMFSLES